MTTSEQNPPARMLTNTFRNSADNGIFQFHVIEIIRLTRLFMEHDVFCFKVMYGFQRLKSNETNSKWFSVCHVDFLISRSLRYTKFGWCSIPEVSATKVVLFESKATQWNHQCDQGEVGLVLVFMGWYLVRLVRSSCAKDVLLLLWWLLLLLLLLMMIDMTMMMMLLLLSLLLLSKFLGHD